MRAASAAAAAATTMRQTQQRQHVGPAVQEKRLMRQEAAARHSMSNSVDRNIANMMDAPNKWQRQTFDKAHP